MSAESREQMRAVAERMRELSADAEAMRWYPSDDHDGMDSVPWHEVNSAWHDRVRDHLDAWSPAVTHAVSQILNSVSRAFEEGEWTVESDVVPTWLHCELDNLVAVFNREAGA